MSDPRGEVATRYGIYLAARKLARRTTFYIGKDGTILHIDQKVKVASHGADVAKELKKLRVAKAPKGQEKAP